MTIEIKSTKKAWMVLVNSDLTEGRGFDVVKAVCSTEATARRIAKGASTQGCDGEVLTVDIFKIESGRQWHGPIALVPSTKEDDLRQAIIDKARAAEEKARAAGLTADEISAIRHGAK
jgi:hypothetical protein